jgi:hypothetical protein
MRLDAGSFQLLHDEPPAGAAFHRERHLALAGEAVQELP